MFMRAAVTPLLAALAVVLAGGAAIAAESGSSGLSPGAQQQIVAAAIRAVKPALVKIDVVKAEYEGGREAKLEASGSGAIITPEGHVITNHHVAGDAKRLVCTLADHSEIEADLVGSDPLSDIAVIKLKPKKPTVFPAAAFGDSSALKTGDRVLAMGSPLSFSQSVTMGIVANTQLVMPRDSWYYRIRIEGVDVGSIVRWIAHDAAIYPGNSGGPLVDLSGHIVGINELKIGLSAAIPSNLAKEVAAQLIATGEVARSWIGLEVQPQPLRIPPQRGVLVAGTIPGSPAEKAGFLPGDVLTRFAGQDINVQFREELVGFNQLVFNLPIGSETEAVVMRGGSPVTLRVRTERREKARPKEQEIKRWGMCARDLSEMAVKEMRLDTREGVLVTSVRAGGPCGEAKPPIGERDVIVRVQDTPVRNVADLVQATDRITAGAAAPVPALVSFIRGGGRYLTVVKVGIKELEDPGREVRKAWLPIASQVLTRDIAKQLGAPDRTGVRVTQVYPNSTAEKAGLQVGDVIVGLNGEPVPADEPQDVEVLPAMVRQLRIGSTAELTVLRDGQQVSVGVELAPSPPVAREMKRYRNDDFEFSARDITFFDRVDQRWTPDQAGALVQEVNEGGWAALGNLASGDLIVAVDGSPVTDVVSLEALMNGVAQKRADSVMLQVKRGIHHVFVQMRPVWSPTK
jgi:serine protease Do